MSKELSLETILSLLKEGKANSIAYKRVKYEGEYVFFDGLFDLIDKNIAIVVNNDIREVELELWFRDTVSYIIGVDFDIEAKSLETKPISTPYEGEALLYKLKVTIPYEDIEAITSNNIRYWVKN